eukprot:TRINITY_DN43591_c0_g1_i1.p1 TRINITY_DN43591_c0_g1~~TRINITY_DN43591_c0_g1_i1.p1  ORF type:complete len:118 (+),score=5.02 TRINITY_DN43591_c0_g1_i1:331-684(+)
MFDAAVSKEGRLLVFFSSRSSQLSGSHALASPIFSRFAAERKDTLTCAFCTDPSLARIGPTIGRCLWLNPLFVLYEGGTILDAHLGIASLKDLAELVYRSSGSRSSKPSKACRIGGG